jgi:hypothetical protein
LEENHKRKELIIMPKLKQTAAAALADTVRRNIRSRCAEFDCQTDREVGKKLNIPPSTYALRRNNPKNWTVEQLANVAVALKCTPQWLLTDHSGEITE